MQQLCFVLVNIYCSTGGVLKSLCAASQIKRKTTAVSAGGSKPDLPKMQLLLKRHWEGEIRGLPEQGRHLSLLLAAELCRPRYQTTKLAVEAGGPK